MLCEPILAFVKAFRLRGDANALKQAALGRFNSPMLAAAKKTLWDACTVDLSSLELPLIPRRSSEKRSQASADLEDILLAFNKLDEVDKIPQIYCEAAELVKLPPVVTDPISMLVSSNAACLNELDGKISQLQVDIQNLSSILESSASLDSLPPSSYASAVKSTVNCNPSSGSSSPVTGARKPSRADRADNLVIFGLPEGGSLSDLKNSVDELFTFLVGKSIPLRDLLRVGRRQKPVDSPISTRPRPVLVKLTSSWDRRLVMSIVRKIKDYAIKGIFIREDLTPEERQKRRERLLSRRNTVTTATSSNLHLPPSNDSQVVTVPTEDTHSALDQDSHSV